MPIPLDPVLYQDKGVFVSNFNELVRAHQATANRLIAAEKKLTEINIGDGSDVANLKQQVNDLAAGVADLKKFADATDAKLDSLFPDAGSAPAETPTEPVAEDPPAAEPTPAPDTDLP